MNKIENGKGRERYRRRQTDRRAKTDTGRKPFSERSKAKQTERYTPTVKRRLTD